MEISSPVALVLCGGASRGALEVGFYRAVQELGLRIDFVVGSSIGALNGAYIAAGMPARDLEKLWLGFRRRDAITWNWKGLLQPRSHPGLYTLDPLRELLRRTLPATRFEDLHIPLSITTTDLRLVKSAHWRGAGDIIEPLVASLSLPMIFPPVRIAEHQYVDGGVANNIPIDEANALGARSSLIIQCVCCQPAPGLFSGLRGILWRSLSIAFDCKYNVDLERCGESMQIHVVQPSLRRQIGLLDFSHTAELIDAGYRFTMQYFKRRTEFGILQARLDCECASDRV